ncbi:hypothetical protein E4U14_003447 [Claviceps sp. LM454 group G7]|nr:hypothetical protein E4U14_003447 [Claviceps sp. LM454 group G7]
MTPRTIETITRSSLKDLASSDAAYIRNVKNVSSYNWIDNTLARTIAVPGVPSLWNPPGVPARIQPPKDSGLDDIGDNAIRIARRPMEPLFRAIFTMKPSFDVRTIDVISDRHNILKLLSFIDSSSERDKGESCTIKLELVRNTLLMCRQETNVTQSLAPYQLRGYGHEFEKAYTRKCMFLSTSHYRIISYDFCGLNCIIRHKTFVRYVSSDPKAITRLGLGDVLPRADYLTRNPEKVGVMFGGRTIPLKSTLEIKTCSLTRPAGFGEVAPRLWVSQTPNLVQAFHLRGQFLKPEAKDVSAKTRKWERDNQENLRTLGALIKKINAVVKGCGGRAILRYDVSTVSLIISRDEGESGMLPADLYSKWDE